MVTRGKQLKKEEEGVRVDREPALSEPQMLLLEMLENVLP